MHDSDTMNFRPARKEFQLSIRPMTGSDTSLIADYWLNSDTEHLVGMGVDLSKLPQREELEEMLIRQVHLPDPEKSTLAYIAEIGGKPAGHCNVNQIRFGECATMHLHLWDSSNRRKGLGTGMVQRAIPEFFRRLELKVLWCEPYAKNPAPNRTLEKAGFEFVKRYRTIPGSLNFEQEVNQWKLGLERFKELSESREGSPGSGFSLL